VKSETVVITGASAGLGRATAREFGRREAKIGLLARGIEGLEAAKREIGDLGGTALVLPTDVANSEAIEHAAAVIEEQLGPIDIWVNNAMASVFSPVKEMKPEEFKRVTEVTLSRGRLRNACGFAPYGAAQSRDNCAGRLGPGV
jgi:NADP-dependent 3-hydroxy acid dehydrogenase YdfG